MARRVHVPSLTTGELTLDASQAHHLRDVLRLEKGGSVELFDDSGAVASGEIIALLPDRLTVRVDHVDRRSDTTELVVASAVPKGDRADWMVEKLSELGVTRFIPLQTERSVVHPTGNSKRDRWMRIATESAKQSRRIGVMKIDPLLDLHTLLPAPGVGEPAKKANSWFLSTEDSASPIHDEIRPPIGSVSLFIGPEGGWTEQEIERMKWNGLTGLKLTATILRVETAAIAAAAIAATLLVRR